MKIIIIIIIIWMKINEKFLITFFSSFFKTWGHGFQGKPHNKNMKKFDEF